MSTIGHELQHVIDVLREPTARRDAQLLFLLFPTGNAIDGKRETTDALRAGDSVRNEVASFAHRLDGTITMIRRFALCWTATVALVLASEPVASSPAREPDVLTFEVASVRPNADSTASPHFDWQPSGRVIITAEPLFQLIRFAYNSNAIQTEGQILGPSWLKSERFDIVAKATGRLDGDETGRPMRLLAMLRSLLEERFHVRVHTEARTASVYLLSLNQKDRTLGPKLHASTQPDCRGPVGTLVPVESTRWCGSRGGGTGHFTIQGMTMPDIAWVLATSWSIGRPVLDRTGLSGRWDAQLDFVPTFVPGPTANGAPVSNPDAASGPDMFSALRDQLGLTLHAAKAKAPYLVIDHVERPSQE